MVDSTQACRRGCLTRPARRASEHARRDTRDARRMCMGRTRRACGIAEADVHKDTEGEERDGERGEGGVEHGIKARALHHVLRRTRRASILSGTVILTHRL